MPRLKKNIKKNIINLIKEGKSLNYIRSKTGVSKTTSYYYMKKINGRRYLPIKLKLKNKELIVEIIGLFAGDGYYVNNVWDKRIRIYFNAKEIRLIDYYRKSFKKLTNKLPAVLSQKSVKIMQLHSKDFCNFILSYVIFGKRKVKTIELKNKLLLKDIKFVTGFLRGLIDSDGYVRKGRKEIYFGSISKNLFTDFLHSLNLFNFRYKTYVQKRDGFQDFYKVRLSGNEVDRFVKLIKPQKRF